MVSNCSPGHDASIGIQCDFASLSIFEVDLSCSLSTILFVITSGDVNIDRDPKRFFYKCCKSFDELSNAVCRLSLRFVDFEN